MSTCADCGQKNPAGARFCLACGAPLGAVAEPAETRKTVSVLFCDVVDSTRLGERLDAEAHRRVIGRYFDAVRTVIDRHGGTVEKFIGDAVMAVFGIPTVHEDDALRAVRSASELREAVAPMDRELERDHGVRLRVRVGVATGEVVAGDPAAGQAFVTGDTVVTAERLESAARPSDVLIADSTYRLVADAVIAEPVDPVNAKGKAAPVTAWRLLGVQPGAPGVARRFDTPLVGRQRELAALREAFDQAAAERRCRLVTVLGAAGIGKSRLVREFLLDAGPEATILIGRCLPYGDGITFWPVSEVLPDENFKGTTDEIFWRVRKRFEELGREQPVVLCFDDVHWAEPTFLNLIEYLHGWITDAPVLLLCLARPDLNEHHPAWLSTHGDTIVLTLAPLSGEEVAALVDALEAPPETRDRIAEAAEGNPLFVEQMAAMAVEEGPAFVVPPSIRALIAARLDRLTTEERIVVDRAAVIGREFPLRAVVELAPDDIRPTVAGHLLGLVRKELVRPEVIAFADEDGFRFRHSLIRDAAYEGMSKQLRATLHERYARWLDRHGGDDVIIGYHLEQAFRASEQIGRIDDAMRALAKEAGELLGAAGRRAFARDDMPAAANLLERAASLLTAEHPAYREVLRELSGAHYVVGDAAHAEALLSEVIEAAAAAGDRRAEWNARLERAGRSAGVDELLGVAREAIATFEEIGDDVGLARAWRQVARASRLLGRYRESEAASENALLFARQAGSIREESRIVDTLCTSLLFGPTPTPEAIARCERLLDELRENAFGIANVATSLAGLVAMRGDFERARELLADAERTYEDQGLLVPLGGLTEVAAVVELMAGDPETAERGLRRGLDILTGVGVPMLHWTLLAESLAAQGRPLEAEACLAETQAHSSGPADNVRLAAVQARLAALKGAWATAEERARSAVTVAAETDSLVLQGGALAALAEVLLLAERVDQAEPILDEARQIFAAKGDLVSERRTRTLLRSPIG